MKNIKFVELFAGIGGFRYGLENISSNRQQQTNPNFERERNSIIPESIQSNKPKKWGYYTCIWANEWDKYAVKIYEKNFGEKPDTRDIRTVDANEIPDHDLLTAGFPCQAFSIAGHRKGFEDTRGTLFFDIARILNTKRPRFLLLENVRGLLSHDKGRTFKIILSTLNELGYDLQWQVLNSKDFGVPQNRERVFIVGHIRGTSRPKIFPFRESNGLSGKSRKKRKIENKFATEITSNYKKGVHSGGETLILHNIYGGFNESKPRIFKEYSPTIRTPKGGGHLPMLAFIQNPKLRDYKKRKIASSLIASQYKEPQVINCVRRLTPTECERLQGFSDDWTKYGIDEKGNEVLNSDTQRYKCLGNAVTTNVITEIGKRLINETHSES